MAHREDTVRIPRSILMTVSSLDELEDWLESHDPVLLADLRRIRSEESEKGKGLTLDQLRKEWNIPS